MEGGATGGTDEDYYAVLEVDFEATEEEIRAQYRKKALQWHPDKHPHRGEEAKRKFQLIGEAYRVLSDPNLRAKYDASARWDVDKFPVEEYLKRFKEFMLSPHALGTQLNKRDTTFCTDGIGEYIE